MTTFIVAAACTLASLMLVILVRVFKGPQLMDRVLGVNVISTKTTLLILFAGAFFHRMDMFVDVALAYAMLNFIGSLALARYFEHKRVVDDKIIEEKVTHGEAG